MTMNNTIYEVPLNEIEISDFNVRQEDRRKDLDELKASIIKHGLLQPVVLIGEFGRPPYELIAGQRRYLAHEALGIEKIRSIFESDLDEAQIIVRSLVENLQRLDLDYPDAAKAITTLYLKYNRDDRQVADETGLSLRKVRDYIRLEEVATEDMKKLLASGKVTPADAKRAIKASGGDNSKAEELLNLIAEYPLSSAQKKRITYYAEKDADASSLEILEKAMAPHIEETIVVSLNDELKEAVRKAMVEMSLEAEEFAHKAIRDWLYQKGFLA